MLGQIEDRLGLLLKDDGLISAPEKLLETFDAKALRRGYWARDRRSFEDGRVAVLFFAKEF